jgi:hypothetical protein
MKIFCSRKLLLRFRRECRELFPCEHIAALFGKRLPSGDIRITRLKALMHNGSDADGIDIKLRHIMSSKMSALRKKEDWVGTIHSHCNRVTDRCCWHLSKTDIKSALEYGEAVCGIVYVDEKGTRTSVHWYIPRPIPDVAYY